MTGAYPLIAGKWCESEPQGIFVLIQQDGNKFVANCTYTYRKGMKVHWRANGTISKDGEITAHLVHITPKDFKTQTRTGKLDLDGSTLHGHAAWDDGGHDFTWTLKEPYGAGPKSSLSRPNGAILVMTFDNDTVFTKDGSVFVKDLSGRGSLGEIHGARVVPGKVGKALKFDGRDYVKVSGKYPSRASPRTISAWVRCDEQEDGGLQVVVKYGGGPQGRAFGISVWPDKMWGIHGHYADLLTTIHSDTQWHHHVITYDGDEGAYYYDGQQVARGPIQYVDPESPNSKQATRPLDTASSPMVFGCMLASPPTEFFTGTLDEVVVYDRVLTAEEIRTLYQMGLNGQNLNE
jgi:hypothetical protein